MTRSRCARRIHGGGVRSTVRVPVARVPIARVPIARGGVAGGTLAAVLACTAGVSAGGPMAPAGPLADPVMDTAVDLRLGHVLEEVLAEPARDPLARAVYRVRMARADVAAAAAEGSAGAVLVERVEALFDRSAALLEAFPDHPLAGSWRLDRAEDAWRWLWTLEAAGLRTLLGVPDEAASRRARRASRVLREEVSAARTGLDAAIERLEFDPGWPDDPAIRREHRRLTEEERDGRLPRLQAIAAALEILVPGTGGGDSPADPDAGAVDAAVAALLEAEAGLVPPGAEPTGDPTAAAAASFARLRGHVLARAGRGEAAAAAFDAASDLADRGGDSFGAAVARVAADAASARHAEAAARAAAVGRLAAIASGDDPGLAATGAADFIILLAADAAARAVLETPGVDRTTFATGLRGWERLAERDAAWFAIVRERAAGIAGSPDPSTLDALADDAPAVLRLGRADVLQASHPDAARRTYLAVAGDGDSTTIARVAAWRSLGRLEAAVGRVALAARATLAASAVEPDAGRSAALLDAALRLAASTEPTSVAEDPDTAAAPDWPWPDGLGLADEPDPLGAAVDEAARRHPDLPGLDRWRTILAGRLIRAGRDDAAAATLADVPADAAEAPAAAAARLALARDRLRVAVADAADADDADDAGPSRAARATAVADAATVLLDELDVARGLVAAGDDPEGLLARRVGDGRDGVLAAEAQLALGRPDRVLAALGLAGAATSADAPGRPAPDAGPDTASPAVASSDPAVAAAAAELAVRAALVLVERDPGRPIARPLADAAAASPSAARRIVLELERRLDALEADPRPIDDPARAADAARTIAPLAAGVAGWLRAVPPSGAAEAAEAAEAVGADGADGASAPDAAAPGAADAEARRRLRAVAFRAVGRAELAAGRHAAAAEWFDALGGLEASDPAILLGAADARLAAARAAADAGRPVDAASLAGAMTAWRRIAGDRAAAGDRRWWTAQLRMLQALELAERRTDTIAPRIERLRLEDPELGGPSLRPAFEALARRHAG